MNDEEMARVAEILKRQLRLATPENYRTQRETVLDIHRSFALWFESADPDFLTDKFHDLTFEEYPADLYG